MKLAATIAGTLFVLVIMSPYFLVPIMSELVALFYYIAVVMVVPFLGIIYVAIREKM